MRENLKPEKKCDLHLHSSYSDGVLGPEELIGAVSETKVSCISITDHDSIKAVIEVKDKPCPNFLEIVEGVELTSSYQNSEVHILGYLINLEDETFKKKIKEARRVRQLRFREMAEKLILEGLAIDKKTLFQKVKNITPTRLNLAKYLLEAGQVNSISEAFKRYLNPGKPAYTCRSRFSSQEAIDLIHQNGGLAFLAHPHKLIKQDWLDDFLIFGIDGLETAYPTMEKSQESFYREYALKNKLLLSGGSDFHGHFNQFREIGCVDVPYNWVLRMKKRKKELIELKKT